MMSASKLKPYPEYKDSNVNGLGKIPYHWSVERIATLGRISKGSGGSKEDNVESGLPCIRYGDLYTHHNFVVKDFKTQISAESASRYTTLERGDILFAASGESIEEIGKSVLFNLDETAYCGGDNIICKTGGADDSDFLGFATNAPYFAAQKSMVGRGYTVLHIYGTQLRDLRLALPPIKERNAISNFISQNKNLLDSQIRALENLLPLLEEKRSNLITKAVTNGLNQNVQMKDTCVEWLSEIPTHWQDGLVKRFYKVDLGKMLDSKKQAGDSKPYLRAANIHWDEIRLDSVNKMGFTKKQQSHYRLKKGDLLITEGGHTVGRSAIWYEDFECYFQNSLNRVRAKSVSEEKYLHYIMFHLKLSGYLNMISDTATFAHLTKEKLEALTIPMPPVEEQKMIISYLDDFCKRVDSSKLIIENQIAHPKH